MGTAGGSGRFGARPARGAFDTQAEEQALRYSNPRIPEGINTTATHPLKELAVLLGGSLALLAVLVLGLGLAADALSVRIPFAYEASIADSVAPDTEPSPQQAAIATLAARLSAVMTLPEGMTVSVHYVDDDVVNAGATLGGNVLVYRGLVERMPSENALAMVLAHEIAHIKHRHPIRSLGRGLVVMLAMAAVLGVEGDGAATLLQGTGTLALLGFSRAQESDADADAIAAVQALYGHVGGALDAYRALLEAHGESEPPAVLATHPHMDERIAELEEITARAGLAAGTPRALPPVLLETPQPAPI